MHLLQVSPVCLIHGPFGCGKSTLLAAMIQLFADSKAIAGTQMRVLLAAHTNRAVDNVLSRLLTLGFTGELALTGTTCQAAATSSERPHALRMEIWVLGCGGCFSAVMHLQPPGIR